MIWLQPVAAMLLGMWAGVMAWQGWALYHDGIRPLLAEWAEGNRERSHLIAASAESNQPFTLGSLGLSLVVGVPMAHWLWLPAEGFAFRSRRLWLAALAGAAWGGLGWLIIWGGRALMALLPVSPLPSWEKGLTLVLSGLMVAPALAAGHRWGTGAGGAALLLSAAGAVSGATMAAPGSRVAAAAGLGALLGSITFAIMLFRELRTQAPVITGLPVRPRRAPLWALIIQGAVLALAVRSGVLGWGTADAIAAARALWLPGAALTLPLLFAFAPQWASSQASTGVGQLAGAGLAVVAGFVSPTPWMAPLLGGGAALLEPLLSGYALRHPALSEAGESMRWAMGKCGQPAILAGMIWAAADLMPAGLGVAVVIAVTVTNDYAARGIWKTAVPAWGLLLATLLANLWHLLGG